MVKKKENKIDIKRSKKENYKSKIPTVWDPFDIGHEIERDFWSDPWNTFWNRKWGARYPKANSLENPWTPAEFKSTPVDLIDKGDKYYVIAEMPGVDKKDIDLTLSENNLRISGETKTETNKEDEGYLHRELGYTTLCRTMDFPEDVNIDKAKASLKNGILEISIPKKNTSKKRKNIPIK